MSDIAYANLAIVVAVVSLAVNLWLLIRYWRR
jgi:hypothetical protein